ncbi:MAG: DNA topoisomerase [Eubacteriales bacterium]
MKQGDVLKHDETTPSQHFTEPPPRYNEASLVKFLEERGIGRPSTFATIYNYNHPWICSPRGQIAEADRARRAYDEADGRLLPEDRRL